MNNNVNLWIRTFNNGQNLFNGTSFEESLLLELNNNRNYEDFKILLNLIEKKNEHPVDIINRYYRDDVFIQFEFAKHLMFCDIIEADCLCSKTEIGKSIIELIKMASISFVLTFKKWRSSEILDLEFEACHEDYEYEVLNILRKGDYDFN